MNEVNIQILGSTTKLISFLDTSLFPFLPFSGDKHIFFQFGDHHLLTMTHFGISAAKLEVRFFFNSVSIKYATHCCHG